MGKAKNNGAEAPRALKEAMDLQGYNATHLHPHLRRAVEVALAGGFTITPYIDPVYKAGMEDFPLIMEAFRGVRYTSFVPEGGDMLVTLSLPREGYMLPPRLEPDGVLLERVERARGVVFPDELDRTAKALLENAVDRAGLSLRRRQAAIRVGGVVAALHGSPVITPSHIAEGIQYQLPPARNGRPAVLAMGGAVEFGGGAIRVSPLEIEPMDIKAAIGHLQSLLPGGVA